MGTMKGIITTVFSVFLIFVFTVVGDASTQCKDCHEEMTVDHAASVHKDIQCLECHAQVAEEDHEQVAHVDCRQCHAPHAEKLIHDAHSRIACGTCHVKGTVHQFETNNRCGNCHFQGNTLGASSMVLPAKSILCMPCHVATFSVGDKTTLVSLFMFLVGLVGLGTIWFSGSIHRVGQSSGRKIKVKTRLKPNTLFLSRFFQLLKTIFIEVVLLQRLFRQSPRRWTIHALIFFPFFFRFIFGMTALLLSMFLPDGSVTLAMLDKNHAMRALFFDVTGLMILMGLVAVIGRKNHDQNGTITLLPEPGRGMPIIMGLIVFVGFLLEGLRIAMTGWPGGAEWAFLGYGISMLFKGMAGLTAIYGYVWYAHAILTGAFIALIPFTRMAHIITAPIVLIMNARSRAKDCFRK